MNYAHYTRKLLLTIFLFLSLILLASISQKFQNFIYPLFTILPISKFYINITSIFGQIKSIVVCVWIGSGLILFFMWLVTQKIIPLISKSRWQNRMRETNENDLQHELYSFISSDDKSCFLLDGAWGVGKTWQITKLLDNLRTSKFKDAYRVSCFGLSSRELLTQELRKVCEANDTTLRKKYIDLMRSVPVVGDLLHTLLKKSYSLESIPKGSVFIFDDFERTASLFLSESSRDHMLRKTGFEEIDSPLDNLLAKTASLELSGNAVVATQYSEKFSVVIGFINDLIETYCMRVVIVANLENIPYTIIRDTLESKLNCRKYHLEISEDRILDTLLSQVNRNMNVDSNGKKLVSYYLRKRINDIRSSWHKTGFKNLRILCSVTNALMLVIEQNPIKISELYMDDIFFTILICHYEHEFNSGSRLKNISLGENPLAFDNKHQGFRRSHYGLSIPREYMKEISIIKEIRWVGNRIGMGYINGYYSFILSDFEVQKIRSYDNEYGLSIINGFNLTTSIPHSLDEFVYDLLINEVRKREEYVDLLNNGKLDYFNFSHSFLASNEQDSNIYQDLLILISYLEDRFKDQKKFDVAILNLFFSKLEIAYPLLRAEFMKNKHNLEVHKYSEYLKQI